MFANVRGTSTLTGVVGVGLVVALYLVGLGMMWRSWNTAGLDGGQADRCEVVCAKLATGAKG